MPNATAAIHVIANNDVAKIRLFRSCKKPPRYCQAERIPLRRKLPVVLPKAARFWVGRGCPNASHLQILKVARIGTARIIPGVRGLRQNPFH